MEFGASPQTGRRRSESCGARSNWELISSTLRIPTARTWAEEIIAEALHPLSGRPGDRDEGRLRAAGAKQMGRKRKAGTFAVRLRRKPATAAPGSDRSLSTPSNRSEGAGRRSVRRFEGFAGARKNQTHRLIRSEREANSGCPKDRFHRKRPEPIQRYRPRVGRGFGILREAEARIHSVVSTRGRQTLRHGQSDQSRRDATKSYAISDRVGMAIVAISRNTADSWNLARWHTSRKMSPQPG